MNNHDLYQSGQFNQSFVMHPIILNAQHHTNPDRNSKVNSRLTVKLNNHPKKSHNDDFQYQTKDNYGQYQQLKLNKYLYHDGMETTNQYNTTNTSYNNNNMKNNTKSHYHNIIEICTIHLGSNTLQLHSQFIDLMKKYTPYDINFITVVGDNKTGKSLFSDKIFNLCEIKGNNYCHKGLQEQKYDGGKAGIYLCQKPFIKDNVCIFVCEIGNCGFNDYAFKVLNAIGLMISSQYVLINDHDDKSQKSLKLFSQALADTLKLFDLPHDQYKHNHYFPHVLHNLYRSQSSNLSQSYPQSLYPFTNIHHHYLPQAKTSTYKGPDSDLIQLPFMMKSVINPEYINQISKIFTSIYNMVQHKKVIIDSQEYNNQNQTNQNYSPLILNSNILTKSLQLIFPTLQSLSFQKNPSRSHSIIHLNQHYNKILEQLYISAYNYSILSYHQQLSEYFSDQQPKQLQKVLAIFQLCRFHVLEQFDKFIINKKLHDLYQKKLQMHVDSKEQIIIQVNRTKIQNTLRQYISEQGLTSKSNPQEIIQILKSFKQQLNDGRQNISRQLLCQIYKNGNTSSVDFKVKKQIQRLFKQIGIKQQQLEIVKKKSNQEKKKNQEKKSQFRNLKDQEKQLDKEINQILEEVDGQKKKAENIKEGRGLEEAVGHREKLHSDLQKSKDMLTKLKSQNIQQTMNQITSLKRKEIQEIINQQKVIQDKLTALKTSAVQNVSTDKSKNKSAEKPKMTSAEKDKNKMSNTNQSKMNQSKMNQSKMKQSKMKQSKVKNSDSKVKKSSKK